MRYSLLSVVLAGVALSACTGPVIIGGTAAAIVLTRPDKPPPADTQSQIPPHESWCYSTMAEPECFAHPQADAGGRLINVEPQSRYPLDAEAYRRAVAEKPVAVAAPTVLPPPDVEVEKKKLKDELDAPGTTTVIVQPEPEPIVVAPPAVPQ